MPTAEKGRIELAIDEALNARHAREFDRAKRLYSAIIDDPESGRKWAAFSHNELAYIATEEGDDERAETHLRKAVTLAPRSELASLQLYHVLRRRYGQVVAVTEALRLVKERDSDEYRELFSETYCNALPLEARPTAHAVRETLKRYRTSS